MMLIMMEVNDGGDKYYKDAIHQNTSAKIL